MGETLEDMVMKNVEFETVGDDLYFFG